MMRTLRPVAATALLLLLAVFLLPMLLLGSAEKEEAPEESGPLPTATLPIQKPTAQSGAGGDGATLIRVAMPDETVASLTMAEYLWRVVAAEMPAAFEEEALKAQACAARTYTVRKQAHTTDAHPEADVCTDINCCQAYVPREMAESRWGVSAQTYAQKIETAIAGTDGLGVLYQGEPIQAVFFSSAPGRTVDAVEVWGNQVDYLQSVESPEGEEVPNYHSQAVFSADQVREAVLGLEAVDRNIFLRHYFWGQGVRQIAQEMDMNESTVKSRLKRGREKLRAILKKEDA